MNYFKITVLSSFLIFLAVVQAQDYFENDYGEPTIRERREVRDYILQNNDQFRDHLRFRRDDQNMRLRRSGGAHGGGGHGGGGHGGGGHEGVTGPVHTFVKTDEHAHFKWGVRHHVGHDYAGGHH